MMTWHVLTLVGALAVGLLACGGTPHIEASFTPRSVATDTRPSGEEAVLVYAGDIATLAAQPGVEVLGSVDIAARHALDADREEAVCIFAARHGATHVVAADRNAEALLPGSTAAGERAGHLVFVALRVPMRDWERLPPAMVPHRALPRD